MRGCGLMRRDEVSGESAFVKTRSLVRALSSAVRLPVIQILTGGGLSIQSICTRTRKRSVSSGLFCLFL